MEWYYGSGVEDLVVPNDGGTDRLPSPDSWSKWGISASECFKSPNKCYSMYPQFNKDLNFEDSSFFHDVEMETSVNEKDLSSCSSICEGYSDDSLQQRARPYNRASNQLEDMEGLEQMDDIFLSSLLDDLPGAENVHKSYFLGPDSNGMFPTNSVSTDMTLEAQSFSSSVHSAGSSKYLKTHAFSPAVGSEKEYATSSQFVQCNSEQKDCPPLKGGRVFPEPEQGNLNELVGEETSVEESVLHELEMVMTQLNEKTRICFRDALYRLANNSKANHATDSQDGEPTVEVEKASTWSEDDTLRSGSKQRTESETNTIDRAIADLMFNEIDFNAQDLSGGSLLESKEDVIGSTRQQTDNAYRPQIPHPHDHPVLRHDAEVPVLVQSDMDVLVQSDMDVAADHQIHERFSSCNAGGKRKSSMREFESATGY